MAKSDNNGQKLFGTEFSGFNKKQVNDYIAALDRKYADALSQKDAEINSWVSSYNELQDKYAELFDSYMALQEEKAKIADVLIGAENRAGEIIAQARETAENERVALEAQAESLREIIVDKNKILKDMRDSANAVFAEFETFLNAKVGEMCTAFEVGLAELNNKTETVIKTAEDKNEEVIAIAEDTSVNDNDDDCISAVTPEEEIISGDSETAEDYIDNEISGIFADDETSDSGDFI